MECYAVPTGEYS